MRYLHTVILAICAVVLLFFATALNEEIMAMFSFAFGGVALGTLFPARRNHLEQSRSAPQLEARLGDIEARLRESEADLSTAIHEIDRLKLAAEFDRELRQASSPRLRPPSE